MDISRHTRALSVLQLSAAGLHASAAQTPHLCMQPGEGDLPSRRIVLLGNVLDPLHQLNVLRAADMDAAQSRHRICWTQVSAADNHTSHSSFARRWR
jgi:hypothetical protein